MLSNWKMLNRSRRTRRSFNRLFREFESSKITVENFTSSYNAAIKELGGLVQRGLAAGGTAGITQALRSARLPNTGTNWGLQAANQARFRATA